MEVAADALRRMGAKVIPWERDPDWILPTCKPDPPDSEAPRAR
jgi:phosphomannomutase